ncbi:hypothetical protein ATI61_116200 [Archangium gephyra]|uniref:Uncharacterized protein n=1 Tax=Archangium gephyra TaxID=48 RepID=A0AAC8QA51_9BACT|nr:hypothetical protein [Archangium gephyra]AKJ03955.1 Hypothetical protein AA314_05581 [Archangium gephyra]REG23728.1 hypothetical protein ATI61_116200 [Archangium gephyra]
MNQKGYDDLPADAREPLDTFIYERGILGGIRFIRERLGCSLARAQEVFVLRYRKLRELEPGRFTCSDDEYWEGFYS